MSPVARLLLAGGAAAARARAATTLVAGRARAATSLAAARVRAAADYLRPGVAADYIRAGSPRWRATVRPAMDEFLDGLPRPWDLLVRTQEALRNSAIAEIAAFVRARLPSAEALRPAALGELLQAVPRPEALLRDYRPALALGELLQRPVALFRDGRVLALRELLLRAVPRPGVWFRRGHDAGEEALRPRLRRPRPRPRARHVGEDHADGDEVIVDEEDDDRIVATFYGAARGLSSSKAWKMFWDAMLDLHRLKMWGMQLMLKTPPAQRPRKLPVRPDRARTPPRPLGSSSSALTLRSQMITASETLDWIMLWCIPLVDADMAEDVEVRLVADTPPGPSMIAVSPQFSAPFALDVLAVMDPGHVLLLRARPDHGVPHYYIGDLASGTATPLPLPGVLLAPDSMGILSRVGGDGYLVLALQHAPAVPAVLCFDSSTSTWSRIHVDVQVQGVPVGGGNRPWSGHGVVSHGGRVAWVDLTIGFFLFDVHGQERTLSFVPLPTGRALPAGTAGVHRTRCASLCRGVLRYAEVIELDAPHVVLWTFYEADRTWLRGDGVRLDAGLIQELPWIAVIHPHEDVVFVTMGSTIYAADVQRGRVVAEDFLPVELPPPELPSSRFVRAWVCT